MNKSVIVFCPAGFDFSGHTFAYHNALIPMFDRYIVCLPTTSMLPLPDAKRILSVSRTMKSRLNSPSSSLNYYFRPVLTVIVSLLPVVQYLRFVAKELKRGGADNAVMLIEQSNSLELVLLSFFSLIMGLSRTKRVIVVRGAPEKKYEYFFKLFLKLSVRSTTVQRLACDSNVLCDVLSAKYGVRFGYVAIPHMKLIKSYPKKTDSRTLLWPGAGGVLRGQAHIERILSDQRMVRHGIKIAMTKTAFSSMPPELLNSVTLHDSNMDEFQFDKFLCSSSVAIFPFDTSNAGYGLRTSGLVLDCLCRGIICIVQKDTWGSSLLADLGLPSELLVDFEKLTPDFFQEVLSNLEYYQQCFRGVVPRLPQYFGPYVASNTLKQLYES